MALLKKSAEPFRVPTLDEVDPTYAAHSQKRGELYQQLRAAESEEQRIATELREKRTPDVPNRIAKLLGDAVEDEGPTREQLVKARQHATDLRAAVAVIEGRIREAKGSASAAVCEVSRPEYAKRVTAICEALKVLDEAHKSYDELRNQFDANDIAWTRLVPMTPRFLGASNDPDRRIARYIKEAKEAGHYVEN